MIVENVLELDLQGPPQVGAEPFDIRFRAESSASMQNGSSEERIAAQLDDFCKSLPP